MPFSSSLTFTISNNSSSWTTNQHTPSHSLNTFSITLNNPLHKTRVFTIHCIKPEPLAPLENPKYDDQPSQPAIGGDDGDDGGDFTGGGGNGDRDGEGGGEGDDEFGPLLNFEAVMKKVEARRVTLPSDMEEAARITGIREMFLLRYLELQGSAWPLSFLIKYCSMLRNRMLADPSFLFKVGAEIVIDSCCSTFAEVQKRGKDFWPEFELVAADLLVTAVVDIALVGLLAPYARISSPSSVSKGLLGRIQHACAALPSSVFEAERPGCKFSVTQRIATYFYKGALYGSVGFGCGIVGQGIANMLMSAKRSIRKSEEDIPIPPLLASGALWGFLLAVSSNTRYQILNGLESLVEASPVAKKVPLVAMAFTVGVRFGNKWDLFWQVVLFGVRFLLAVSSNTRYQILNGLESLVEASPVAKKVPLVAMAFTVGVRFGNNIYGSMQFIDWAKLTGVQ